MGARNSSLLFPLFVCVAWIASALPCAAEEAEANGLASLLEASQLRYMMSGEDTAIVLVKGRDKVHVVTVRQVEGVVAAFVEIARVAEDDVPSALWKKAFAFNARAALAHVGYAGATSAFYSISGVSGLTEIPPVLIRAMVRDVASLADELQLTFQDFLAVE